MNRRAVKRANHRAANRRPQRPRTLAAFTLLEVILSLSLAGLLLGALTWAIQLNLKATSSGRDDVERAQLARAALDRMASDIRSAVWYEPIDPQSLVVPPAVSSLSSSSSSSGASGASSSGGGNTTANPVQPVAPVGATGGSTGSTGSTGGGGRSGGGGGSGGSRGGSSGGGSSGGGAASGGGASGSSMSGSSPGGSGAGGGSSASGSSSSSSTSTTNLPPPMPGLFGGANWLQVDVSRLPRLDQFMMSAAAPNGAANPNGVINRPSEIKSVFYYLAGSGQALPPALSNTATAGATGENEGLMRREADRLTTVWQTLGGGGQMAAGAGPEALAPEVEQLEFRYYNGSTYANTWDSRVYGCLPRAVEIRMTLKPPSASEPSPASSGSSLARRSPRDEQPTKYRILVPIPAWKPPPLQTADPTLTSSTTGSSAGSSSTGVSSGSR